MKNITMIRFAFLLLIVSFGLVPNAFAQEENKLPPVDWVQVESAGSISSAKQGAMDKTIWKDQNRSDIEFLLSKLPTRIELRSVLDLQRRLLLSSSNSSLITNDIGPLRGNDLFIKRIKKLMDMGLYDDAWTLYIQKAENPYDVSIAQLGMLLLIIKNDLATACLEEKVLSPQYPNDKFFALLDKACTQTLGASDAPQFPNNATLQSVYNDPSFKVFAKSYETLNTMNHLERALVLANNKINYDGLTPDILTKTPSALVALYVMDKSMPDSARKMVENEMQLRGLAWHTKSLAKNDLLKRAMDLSKDPQSQWPVLESALTNIKNPADLVPFADMIAKSTPPNISTETTIKVLGALLANNNSLPKFWVDAAQKAASQKPIVYIYLIAFNALTPTKGIEMDTEKAKTAFGKINPADMDQIIAIIGTIDKQSEIHNNPIEVYEKHLSLTLNNNYVMTVYGLNLMLDMAVQKKQIGITILASLNALAAKPDTLYSVNVAKTLSSMLSVGLIEDTRLVGGEIIASVLNKY